MSEANVAIIEDFLIESFENLSNIGNELTQFERDQSDKELLNSIFRKVHTLKGSVSFLGFKKIQEITHSAENLLDLIREDKIQFSSEIIDVLLESFDACIELLKHIEEKYVENDQDYSSIIAKLVNILEKNVIGEDSIFNPDIVGEKDENFQAESYEEESNVTSLNIVKPPAAVSENKLDSAKKNSSKEASKEKSKKQATSVTDSIVRVDVRLIDKIMNVVGELVLNRNQIVQFAYTNDESSEFTRLSHQLDVITTELQTKIMMVRMQPIGRVLSKFERIVRDLSREQGKKIGFSISGGDTELDKTLVDAIKDPLTHLIRNSIDHGIELPEVRLDKGKVEEGHIEIKAYHEGGQVTIEINDDGNGIDPEKVLRSAIKKEVISEVDASGLTEKEILNLIFKPGFSTAEKVTNISGRGVGMDVVKSNIEQIGGSVDVISILGEGSTFKLKIPLTLAIVPALVVKGRNETFALPQNNLVELVRIDETGDSVIEEIHGDEFFRLRGDLIPVFRLNECLRLPEVPLDEETNFKKELSKRTSRSTNIVILNAESRYYGLIVDQVLDTEEIVVKPLSKKLKNLSLYAGATIMGNGRACLIVDAMGFFNMVDNGMKASKYSSDNSNEGKDGNNFDRIEVLLFKLNDFRTYAVPLAVVNRLEEFPLKNIEWSGNVAIVRYRNTPMPLLNVEEILGLGGTSKLKSKEYDSEIISCVVLKTHGRYFALAVHSIQDIALSDSDVCSAVSDRAGILGSIFINGKTVSMLNVYAILEVYAKGKSIALSSDKTGRILVVDDSPFYRKIETDFLKEMGFEVVSAFNGENGIEVLKKDKTIDIVISDIEMPVMNGYQMAKEIRTMKQTFSDIPIIALSTRVSKEDRAVGKDAGFTEHLEKFDKEEVLTAVNKMLDRVI